jgi:hypothetical protein
MCDALMARRGRWASASRAGEATDSCGGALEENGSTQRKCTTAGVRLGLLGSLLVIKSAWSGDVLNLRK